MSTSSDTNVMELAARAKAASATLAASTAEQRNAALLAMAAALEKHSEAILTANKKDVEAAQAQLAAGEISDALVGRLKLDQAKLQTVIDGIRQVAALPDPLGHVSLAKELDEGLNLTRVTCPIGVIAVIFESRPDVLPQIVSLCIKSGNATILKGGREALHSNQATFKVVSEALAASGVSSDAIALVHSRESVAEILQASSLVDLIVPRGSNELVRHIQMNTRIPVLGHADGICHVYVDDKADLNKALRIVVDSKVQYPSACNACETLLIHKSIASEFLPRIVTMLLEKNVQLRLDDSSLKCMGAVSTDSTQIGVAYEQDWSTEYCDLILSVKLVESIDEAIAHINRYGSGHTESIVTESDAAFDKFFAQVNSAGVYQNASTRFADGFRYGFGAEVGISTGRMHPRGPVGVEGLVTYKYKLKGSGHIVATYSGPKARRFSHRDVSR